MTAGGPRVEGDGVTFTVIDRYRRLAAVRLIQEIGLDDVAFTRAGTVWTLRVDRPPVDRMEYLFEIEDHNQHRATITDPENPRRAPGAFGEKSVVEFPEYSAPCWCDTTTDVGSTAPFEIDAPRLDGSVSGELWTPAELADHDDAPLIVVHDGPEFASLAGFTHYVAVAAATGFIPPVRVALLAPGERNSWYSANPAYAETLTCDVLPALPPAQATVGVGASLGALAMLHVQVSQDAPFDALFLQSGSFFTPALDPQEARFSGFDAVTSFVASLHGSALDHTTPVTMTCGLAEENLANNEAMAATLERLGCAVALHAIRDAHNYTAWRDAWHPHLTKLISTALTNAA